MKIQFLIGVAFFLLIIAGCNSDDATQPQPSEPWLIPPNQVLSAGPGKDGIPSIDNPRFINVGNANYLSDEDIVISIKMDDEVKAYPHAIMNWHEIANDQIGNNYYSLTYCPLTGTAINWNRELNQQITSFGVSGLLFNSNLIPYDRLTNSNWSQMMMGCVNGELMTTVIKTFPSVEMSWNTFKTTYPDGLVLDKETGVYQSSIYDTYPYGDYKTNSRIFYPISRDDNRLFRKERVLGVSISGKAKAYLFTSFPGDTISIVEDNVGGTNIVVAGSAGLNFMVVYSRTLPDGTQLTFTPSESENNGIMFDNEGNAWDYFGEAVSGPRTNQKLTPFRSYMGYWFAWATFHQGIDIYEN